MSFSRTRSSPSRFWDMGEGRDGFQNHRTAARAQGLIIRGVPRALSLVFGRMLSGNLGPRGADGPGGRPAREGSGGLTWPPTVERLPVPNCRIGKRDYYPGAPMPKTYSDLFAEVRTAIKTISLDELKQRLETKNERPFTLVDVREKDEFRQGYIPGAVHIPRGFLEMQAEQKLPDKSAEIIVY